MKIVNRVWMKVSQLQRLFPLPSFKLRTKGRVQITAGHLVLRHTILLLCYGLLNNRKSSKICLDILSSLATWLIEHGQKLQELNSQYS